MTETKFTPGPWEIGPNTNIYEPALPGIRDRLESLGLPVTFEALSVGKDEGQMALVPLDESNAANAHLIAAAPEMYGECEASLAFLEDDSRSPRRRAAMIRSLKATLAKARGDSDG